MADLAVAFHWPLSEMTPMTVAELMAWRELAIELLNPED